MTPAYFDSQKTSGSKDSIEITVYVKAEKVMDFANEIRNAALNEVLEILDDVSCESSRGGVYWNSAKTITVLRRRIIALKGGE